VHGFHALQNKAALGGGSMLFSKR